MPGSSSAEMEGRAVPVIGAPIVDHTYVTSSCGYVWDCCGQWQGGTVVAAARGDTVVAECLSHPRAPAVGINPPLFAGLRWGRDGFCHQMSNRILYPAGVTVQRSRGFAVSRQLFGTYGKVPLFPAFQKCISGRGGTTIEVLGLTGDYQSWPTVGRSDHSMLSYEAVARRNAESERPGDAQAEFTELVSFYEEQLDRILSQSEALALFKVQVGLRRRQDAMAKQLDQGKLPMDDYLEQLSDAMRDAMSEYRDVLKPDDFYRLFGDAGANPDALLVQDRISTSSL